MWQWNSNANIFPKSLGPQQTLNPMRLQSHSNIFAWWDNVNKQSRDDFNDDFKD